MSGAGSGIAGNQGQSSFAALELLADPQKLQNKINQLKSAEESAREQITLAGPASEILKIREEMDDLKAQATEALRESRAGAEQIIQKAKNQAADIIADAEADAGRVAVAAADRATKTEEAYKEAAEKLAAAKKEEKYLNERETKLTEDRKVLDARASDLESRASLLLQEKSKLASVRE